MPDLVGRALILALSLKSWVDSPGLLEVPDEESRRGGRPASKLGTVFCKPAI